MTEFTLTSLQEAFMTSLHRQNQALLPWMETKGDLPVETRLAIYQNAYQVRLQEALDTDFPMLGLYLGDDLFEEMVHGYLQQHPSKSWTLRYFGDFLPEFLKKTPPFSDHPVLAELAQWERTFVELFDAASGTPLSQEVLQDPTWVEKPLKALPTVQVVQTYWNTPEIWKALKAEKTPPEVQSFETPQAWVFWRNKELISQYRSISAEEAQLLQRLLSEPLSFVDLCELILEEGYEEEVASQKAIEYFQFWIGSPVLEKA